MKNGIPNYNEKVFSDSEKENIKNMYLNENRTLQEIGEKYNCSHKTISRLISKMGIPKRTRRTKYLIDATYFDEINTQNKAYTLGLLYADGYNSISK